MKKNSARLARGHGRGWCVRTLLGRPILGVTKLPMRLSYNLGSRDGVCKLLLVDRGDGDVGKLLLVAETVMSANFSLLITETVMSANLMIAVIFSSLVAVMDGSQ
jgi:hypothetical protein